MNELAIFAGAGGGILGGQLLGWRTICAVELDAYAASVLAQRQNDGSIPIFPIWSDVQTFDGRPWRGIVDVVSGGFPCQDISVAGEGEGIEGARSGLWKEMHRIVGDIRPEWVLLENSPALTSRGLGTVLGDLAQIGYDTEWMCLSAAQCGARHIRNRIWILANTSSQGLPEPKQAELCGSRRRQEWRTTPKFRRWPAEPDVGRVVDGMAGRVDQIRALGNGQVPRVAAAAFALLQQRFQTKQ